MKKKTSYLWEDHYPDNLDWNTVLESKAVYSFLDETAKSYPEHTAIDYYDRTFTFKEIYDLSNRFAKGLQQLGIGKGSKVGILMPNCPQYVVAYFAILKTGATLVNYNPLYAIPELQHQVMNSHTSMMVTLNMNLLHEKTNNLLQTTSLEKVVMCDLRDALTPFKRFFFNWKKKDDIAMVEYGHIHLDYNKLIDNDGLYQPVDVDLENDVAVIQYTGGTTGLPKGAMLTHHSLCTNAQQISLWFNGLVEGKEKMLAVLPFFHVFGMTAVILLSTSKACEMVIHSRFDLPMIMKDVAKKKISLMMAVPSILNAMCDSPKLNKTRFDSLKKCISGGAPLPQKVKERFEAATGCALAEGYGLSEASPVVAVNPLFSDSYKSGSVGLPLPNTVIEIRSPEGRHKLCNTGEIGEICVKAPQLMLGYYENADESKATIKNGRLHTGDMGYLDEEGYLFISDRMKDVVIVNGFNVYPREVEELLYQHHTIKEAAVIGVEDEKTGQAVKAFINVRVGDTIKEEEIIAYLSSKISKYKLPTHIEFMDELPKTMIGKIDKKALKD